jgi:LysM repeat protein
VTQDLQVQRVELPLKSRRPRSAAPRYLIIHTTQGPASIGAQFGATINWMQAGGKEGRSGSWGPSCDIVIGHLGQEAWFTRAGEDFHKTRANWSAGFGASSVETFGADEYGIAIELAQTAAGERPPEATLDAAVRRCAALCLEFGIDPVRIPYLSQRRVEKIPSGLVGHEDTANGKRTGKWDPNARTFPWDEFIRSVAAAVADGASGGEGEVMSYGYIVEEGVSLSRIAARFGQPLEVLALRNSIVDVDRIEVGQVLRLTDSAPVPRGASPATVHPGLLTTVQATGRDPETGRWTWAAKFELDDGGVL